MLNIKLIIKPGCPRSILGTLPKLPAPQGPFTKELKAGTEGDFQEPMSDCLGYIYG